MGIMEAFILLDAIMNDRELSWVNNLELEGILFSARTITVECSSSWIVLFNNFHLRNRYQKRFSWKDGWSPRTDVLIITPNNLADVDGLIFGR
ncbi:hypothetical protein C5167_034144 [Papaver somniferum]|uniref:Uncharacterized protein n=1 Tax=Papaver somniferum TaxID=3469 RepID=A0A4Y7KDP4_PAPSO|nr:hypothetical protein C5167_034144 [Papaver somniferum]